LFEILQAMEAAVFIKR